jgi:Galactose oxidase, central domain
MSKTFTATTGSLNTARTGATATLLPNGEILIAGGSSDGMAANALNTAELYNPVTGAFTVAGSGSGNVMTAVRFGATATLLTNGQVLIAGGQSSTGSPLSSAELYNPATDTFTATGSLGTARYDAAAMLLPNGKVLIAGGTGGTGTLKSAELYSAGTFAPAGTMTAARTGATATLLLNGNVLIAGGSTDGSTPLNTAEIYAGGSFSASNSTLNAARFNGTAALLPNGMVLLAGGASGTSSQTTELYDADSNKFDPTGSLASADQASLTATLLNNGDVLVTGLTSGGSPAADAELYTPSFDPLGTVGLSSSDTSAMPDTFGAPCVLTISGGGVSTCTSMVTPGEVGTNPHTITGTYPADSVHSGNTGSASLTVTP